jgi:hypothetical protein
VIGQEERVVDLRTIKMSGFVYRHLERFPAGYGAGVSVFRKWCFQYGQDFHCFILGVPAMSHLSDYECPKFLFEKWDSK